MTAESAIANYPDHWQLSTLGELCAEGGGAIQTGPFGSQLHASDYVDIGIPSIMPKNISVDGVSSDDIAYISSNDAERLAKYLVKEGDIVYSRRGDVEKCSLMTDRENGWLCGTGCLRVRLGQNNVVSPKFIHAYLSHPAIREWISRHAVGATMPNLNTAILGEVPVLIPPKCEREVVEKLWSDISGKIALNRQTNQTLEQLAQAIFKAWFVDFDPVNAKIRARQNGQDTELAAMCAIAGIPLDDWATAEDLLSKLPEAQRRHLAATAALFPDGMQDSELGEIPVGWVTTTYGEVIGFKLKRVLRKGALAPYLDMRNVPTRGHLADDVNPRKFGSGTKFKNGDTLLARITPCLENGKTAYVDFLDEGQIGWGSTEFIVMRPIGDRPVSLGYFIARQDTFRAKAIQTMTGTSGRQRANANVLADLPCLDFPVGLLQKFELIAGAYLKRARVYGDQNKTLIELRDALLPKLLAGELSPAQVEEAVPL